MHISAAVVAWLHRYKPCTHGPVAGDNAVNKIQAGGALVMPAQECTNLAVVTAYTILHAFLSAPGRVPAKLQDGQRNRKLGNLITADKWDDAITRSTLVLHAVCDER